MPASKPLALLAIAFALLASPLRAQDAEPAPAEAAPPAGAAAGTLRVEVLPFTSELELKKKVREQLESGGIEWGLDGDHLVVTMVNKRFVDFNVSHMTRYGSEEVLTLPAGDYRLTGIGLEMVTGFSPQKILDKGAFLNEDVLRFRIEPGQQTTLRINPIIRKDMTFLVKWYVPALMTTVVQGEASSQEIAINLRNDASTPWKTYTGPLKFVAK